jgi:hypothetical protein
VGPHSYMLKKGNEMTLKSTNFPFVFGFALMLYVGFAFVNGFDWSFAESMEIGKEGVKLKSPVLTLATHFLVLILTYIISPEWKHRAVYLRWDHPLPGSRVFTELCAKDSRISHENLIKKYGELPTSPIEQNSLWYKIYQKKQSDKVLLNSHRHWLLFRDIFSISIILFLPSSVYTLWNIGAIKGLIYTVLNIALTISLWICARNTGNRFASNVLAR